MSTGTGTNCVHHNDRPAVGHCYQCHKPLCQECRYDAISDGIFCNRACYDQHLAYKSRQQPAIKASRLRSLAAGLIILAIIAAAVYIGGGKMGLPVLKSIYKAIFG